MSSGGQRSDAGSLPWAGGGHSPCGMASLTSRPVCHLRAGVTSLACGGGCASEAEFSLLCLHTWVDQGSGSPGGVDTIGSWSPGESPRGIVRQLRIVATAHTRWIVFQEADQAARPLAAAHGSIQISDSSVGTALSSAH